MLVGVLWLHGKKCNVASFFVMASGFGNQISIFFKWKISLKTVFFYKFKNMLIFLGVIKWAVIKYSKQKKRIYFDFHNGSLKCKHFFVSISQI